MKVKALRIGIRFLLVLGASAAVVVGLGACAAKTTPPGASFVYGQLVAPQGFGGSFVALTWKEGLTVVLVDDINAGHESSGSGSTEAPNWRGQGTTRSVDGQQINWRAETTDGKTAMFSINEQAYDLAQGTLFLIRTAGSHMVVTQQKRDLAGRCSDPGNCQDWLTNDPAVAQFIRDTAGSH